MAASSLRAQALRALARRPWLRQELVEYLERKGGEAAAVIAVVEEMVQLGYLRDEEWIQSFIRKQMRLLRSPQIIIYHLKMRGVDVEVAKAAIEELYPKERQKQILERLYSKQGEKSLEKKRAAAWRRGWGAREPF